MAITLRSTLAIGVAAEALLIIVKLITTIKAMTAMKRCITTVVAPAEFRPVVGEVSIDD